MTNRWTKNTNSWKNQEFSSFSKRKKLIRTEVDEKPRPPPSKRREDIRKIGTINFRRNPKYKEQNVKAQRFEEVGYFSKSTIRIQTLSEHRKDRAIKCQIGYPLLNQTVKGTKREKSGPFTKKNEDAAQIYRYKIKKAKARQEIQLSRDIKGNVL